MGRPILTMLEPQKSLFMGKDR